MVQTYQSPVRIYKYPFELVMAAYERRFPTCPQIPIFVGSEILSEYRSPDGAEEVVERKCQLNVEAPYLLKKIAGVDFIYFLQKNSLDKRKRTLLIEATNISFSSRVIVKENCLYYVHPDNEEWTCFEQSASLDVKSFFGFEASVEKLAVKQYAANLAKGKEVLEFFIDELIKSGITHIPKFVDSNPELAIEKTNSRSLTDSAIDVSKGGETDETGSDSTKKNGVDADGGVGTPTQELQKSGSIPQDVVRRRSSVTNALHNGSIDDSEEKLETEYIHRFLGQLTPLEESRLCELKYGLLNAHKGKMPKDAHLLRFLRARDFDVHKARDMIVASLLWRKQHNVDRILSEFVPPPVLLKYFPGGWHHSDLEDRPLFVLRLGKMDVKGILRAVGMENVVKFTLLICEQGLLKAEEATKALGRPISTWTLLVDLEGLCMRHLWRPGVQSLLRIIETVEAHYPETMGLMLISRAPRVFPLLWTLVSPFINENTRKKFMINSSENVISELSKYIAKEKLPTFLGGPCAFENDCKDGWQVPKSEYRPVDTVQQENEDNILTSTYTSAVVYRALPHEVCVHVPTVGCVLTWDFDIIKGECEFIIYHSDKYIKPPAHAQPASPTLNPVELVTAAIGATSLLSPTPTACVIATDPTMRLGRDLTIAARPLSFAEGDSMQGSHFCSQSGSYVMQWRIPEHPSHCALSQPAAAPASDKAENNKQSGTVVSSSSAASASATSTPIAVPTGGSGLTASNTTRARSGSPPTIAPNVVSPGGGALQPQPTLTTHNKCRLMYYYELLNSADFRGSVASLQSCRSSFSSLAASCTTPPLVQDPNGVSVAARKNHNRESSFSSQKVNTILEEQKPGTSSSADAEH